MTTCRTRRIGTVTLCGAAAIVGGCSGPEAMLDPSARPAEQTADLWWFMLALGGTVYVVVMALAVIGFLQGRRREHAHERWRRSDRSDPAGEPDPGRSDDGQHRGDAAQREDDDRARQIGRRLVVYGGIVGPAAVLLLLNVVSVPMSAGIEDRGATASTTVESDELVVEVIAEQFWWRVTYPQYDFETANEIHIPTGERVRLRITSTDVVHSFWVPKLAGKIDATPGHTTEQVLETDDAGRYRGRCSEYCGLAHAQMVVFVVAQDRDDFDAWAANQQAPRSLPTDERIEDGRQIFLSSSCAYCHAVQGHTAPNTIGPDLTYLATRETIAGGTLPNDRAHLGGWIVDPQAQKPGNLMPGTQIAGDELGALIDYLSSLE